MTHPSGYATPPAMWAAVISRAKIAARDTGSAENELHRQFIYQRFLARVFTYAQGDDWVLKGGTALLARVRTARHSQDIDLYRQAGTLDTAVTELRRAAALDLTDHLRFVVDPAPPAVRDERPGQPGRQLATLRIGPYIGVKPLPTFKVDIVIGGTITADPTRQRFTPVIDLPGLDAPTCLLYPLVDHIADKVCATFEVHPPDRTPSSRYRDLVDLVVIARTQPVDAEGLRAAIRAEAAHRGLDTITRWHCPDTWAAPYRAAARNVVECQEHRTYPAATAFVGDFLDPVLSGGCLTSTWNPDHGQWVSNPTSGS